MNDKLANFFSIIALPIFFLAFFAVEEVYTFQETYRTHSVNLQSGVSGSFVYGIGGINSEPYYYVYIDENDLLQLKRIPARVTKIKMNCDKPLLKITKSKIFKKTKSAELCVPAGSIQVEYKMNPTE